MPIDRESPKALTGGEWRTVGGIQRWIPAPPPPPIPRLCETCSADISHKRADARFCDRRCKQVRVEARRPYRERTRSAA